MTRAETEPWDRVLAGGQSPCTECSLTCQVPHTPSHACATQQPGGQNTPGSSFPRAAVQRFLGVLSTHVSHKHSSYKASRHRWDQTFLCWYLNWRRSQEIPGGWALKQNLAQLLFVLLPPQQFILKIFKHTEKSKEWFCDTPLTHCWGSSFVGWEWEVTTHSSHVLLVSRPHWTESAGPRTTTGIAPCLLANA